MIRGVRPLTGRWESPTPPRSYAESLLTLHGSKNAKSGHRESPRLSRIIGIAVLRSFSRGLGNSDGDFANTEFLVQTWQTLVAASGRAVGYAIRHRSLLGRATLGGTAALMAAHLIDRRSRLSSPIHSAAAMQCGRPAQD